MCERRIAWIKSWNVGLPRTIGRTSTKAEHAYSRVWTHKVGGARLYRREYHGSLRILIPTVGKSDAVHVFVDAILPLYFTLNARCSCFELETVRQLCSAVGMTDEGGDPSRTPIARHSERWDSPFIPSFIHPLFRHSEWWKREGSAREESRDRSRGTLVCRRLSSKSITLNLQFFNHFQLSLIYSQGLSEAITADIDYQLMSGQYETTIGSRGSYFMLSRHAILQRRSSSCHVDIEGLQQRKGRT